jgi:hypothetical protein
MSFIPGRMPADSGNETTSEEPPSPVTRRRRSQPRRERAPSDSDAQYEDTLPGVTGLPTGNAARVIRVIVGLVLAGALIIVAASTVSDINNHPDASAVQVTQIYAEGLFYGLVAVGIGIAMYILTRGID